jgi:trehalose synthase
MVDRRVMLQLEEVRITPRPLDRFASIVSEEQLWHAQRMAVTAAKRMEGRVWWNINSTARGGGVAEMLQSLLPYVQGAGITTRWLVIKGTPEYFCLTKRLHHAFHGEFGDGSPLGDAERSIYEAVLEANANELIGLIQPGDIVLLHDPQTAGLASALAHAGAHVIWRCHVGADSSNAETDLAWEFTTPYLTDAAAIVFSRQAYIPSGFDSDRCVIIPPSIDPFSAKNQDLDDATIRAILVHTGLVAGPPSDGQPVFEREDGSPGHVDLQADIIRTGPAPAWDVPLVVQVSRWDPLKDPIGVMRGFAQMGEIPAGAELVLVGPNVTAVSDDPEGVSTFEAVKSTWRQLAQQHRARVHLASLPMADIEENGVIVNALQRHAAVIVQKSLREGFGLTVTEAMWKARPVVASRIGGIQDQIEDGVNGLLIDDPYDLTAFCSALRRVLKDPELAARLGENAHERVRDEFLGLKHLTRYGELLERIDP